MKSAFYTTAFILLFTFIKYGFTLKTILWYLFFVIILTPILYVLNEFILKPFIKKYFNFKKME